MPKTVDHDERRRQIASALWTVIRRDGIGRASVRTVAEQAGWSPSAIRHYFPTQSSLVVFAMERVADRITANVAAVDQSLPPRERALRTLHQILPLTPEGREDVEVWLALVTSSQTDVELRAIADDAHRQLRGLVRRMLDRLVELDELPATLDLALETDRLHAMIDGLALHGAVYPAHTSRRRIERALSAHLDELAGRA